MSADDRPDPHLRAALRHAPDADLQAPPALREAVVAAARAALAADRAAAVPKKRWWQALWSATPMGLGASGAFATLALGGLIALLWRGEPVPPAVVTQQAAAPAAEAPAPASVAQAQAAAPEALREAAPARLELRREAAPARASEAKRKAALNEFLPPAPPALAPSVAQDTTAGAATAPAAVGAAAEPPGLVLRAAKEAARADASASRERVAGALRLAPAADADARWLAEVARVVQDRWRPSADDTIAAAREKQVGTVRVAVGSGRVRWCEAGPPPACRDAALAAEEERLLLAAMPR